MNATLKIGDRVEARWSFHVASTPEPDPKFFVRQGTLGTVRTDDPVVFVEWDDIPAEKKIWPTARDLVRKLSLLELMAEAAS